MSMALTIGLGLGVSLTLSNLAEKWCYPMLAQWCDRLFLSTLALALGSWLL
jgi:hypothetical protein